MDPRNQGVRVTYGTEMPTGSGLGTSAALNLAWLSLVRHMTAGPEDKGRLAAAAYDIEAAIGIEGGLQDQYACAIGGINLLRFASSVSVEPMELSESAITTLQRRLVLCHTGESRLSGNIHHDIWQAFRQGNRRTVNALHRLREIAEDMAGELHLGNLDRVGNLLFENWECQKDLDPQCTTSRIETLFDAAHENGALGGKACGAGGGGCLLFLAADGYETALAEALETLGGKHIPFTFDFEGISITGSRSDSEAQPSSTPFPSPTSDTP